jgi:type II secretory pathway predicted ATPase ExeA
MLSRQTTSTYLEHFGLRERPFSNAADLRFVYLGPHHEQAIAHLLQGLAAPGGLVLLTGDSGLGKTTTCRVLLSRLPERVDVVPILNPSLTPFELLTFACAELGVKCDPDGADPAVLCDALRAKLAARLGARRAVLIVDDAQGLGPDVVDQLSALSSMEIDGRKLLEIVLIGEPELIDLVGRASGPAASQSTGYYLLPFGEQETGAYVRHRLTVAGAGNLFDDEALRDLHRLSAGMPRLINVICDRALAIAVPQGRRTVDAPTIRAAARSVLAPARSPARAAAPREAPRPKSPLVALAPPRRPARRARRQLRPWLVAGGLAVSAVASGAIFLGPRHLTGIGPAAYSRLEAEPSTSAEPSDPNASTRGAESLQPEPSQPLAAVQPDAPPAEPPQVQPEPRPSADIPLKIERIVWAPESRGRMVYVNGHRYVEGQTLENGAVLREIQPDGIIVIQRGQPVRLRSEVR